MDIKEYAKKILEILCTNSGADLNDFEKTWKEISPEEMETFVVKSANEIRELTHRYDSELGTSQKTS